MGWRRFRCWGQCLCLWSLECLCRFERAPTHTYASSTISAGTYLEIKHHFADLYLSLDLFQFFVNTNFFHSTTPNAHIFTSTFHITHQSNFEICLVINCKSGFAFAAGRSFGWIARVHFAERCRMLEDQTPIVVEDFPFVYQITLGMQCHSPCYLSFHFDLSVHAGRQRRICSFLSSCRCPIRQQISQQPSTHFEDSRLLGRESPYQIHLKALPLRLLHH